MDDANSSNIYMVIAEMSQITTTGIDIGLIKYFYEM